MLDSPGMPWRRKIFLKYLWLNHEVFLFVYSNWPKYFIHLEMSFSPGGSWRDGLLWGCLTCGFVLEGRTCVTDPYTCPTWSRGPWVFVASHHRPWRLSARWLPQCLTLKCQLQLKTFFQRTSLSILGPYGDQSLWACDRLRGQTQEKSRWKEL